MLKDDHNLNHRFNQLLLDKIDRDPISPRALEEWAQTKTRILIQELLDYGYIELDDHLKLRRKL